MLKLHVSGAVTAGNRKSAIGNREGRNDVAPSSIPTANQAHTHKPRSCRCASHFRFPTPHSRHSSGFTLLEMLAVIVLIGIVGTIVVTQVGHNMAKGKYGAGKAQLTVISQAVENYTLDNGTPPPQLDALVTRPSNGGNWLGPYLKAKQLKDPWGHDFGYQHPGQHGSYDLIFYGQDGHAGGDGLDKDVGNWE